MAVTVHTYGVRAHWARTLPDEVRTQLWLAHRLRCDLVEIHHRHEAAVAAVWAGHPDVADTVRRVEALEARRVELAGQAGKDRTAARSRRVDTAASRELSQVRRDLKAARQLCRAAKAAALPETGPAFAEAAQVERDEVKALYGTYCQDGVPDRDAGTPVCLYWAVWNDVVDHHRAAVQRMRKARAEGHPAQLRFHRHDGSGSLAVQLQRQAGDPARSPDLLASGGGKWRNVMQVTGTGREGQVRTRIGAEVVTVPVTVHRHLPPDADVTGARLVVRRTAGHNTASYQVTAKIPDPAERDPAGLPVVALHLGWRHCGNGAVQVATWRTTGPVVVPEGLRDVVVAHSATVGAVVLPGSWRRAATRADDLRGRRYSARDKIRASLVEHLAACPPAEDDGWPTAVEVGRWRSPARFAALTFRVWKRPAPGRAAVVDELVDWRRVDRRRWETEAHRRARLVGRRRDAYRRVAAWLVALAGRVVVDDTALPALARRSEAGPDAAPTALEDASASQRVHAAPGSLREQLVATARREGVEVTTVSHLGVTRTHYRCGHVNPADHDYTTRVVGCVGCGQGYDQDLSATLNILGASGAVPPPGVGTARDAV